MAGRIPKAFIDDLLARTDIIEIIGSRISLKRAGREYKANCPFHGEKTPSFTVSAVKQFYHCFGCGAHGTALSFLMENDRLSFQEAVEELAQRLSLEVPYEGGQKFTHDRSLDDLLALMGRVDQYFREQLKHSPRATQYLTGRGLTGETALRFHLGYAPDAWDGLLKVFGATEAGRAQLLLAGLIIERPADSKVAGHYDRFRDRVMFPIRDGRGRVVGFGGRILDKGEPKYLNSPETPIFHKGRELYGLYEARQELRQIERLLVVEGYMDVIQLAQYGVHYAVATLGTATTPEHLERMLRVTQEVVFCFDGDRAGRQAAERALDTSLPLQKDGRQFRFLFLPDGHDPDTYIKAHGREAFERLVSEAQPLSDVLLQQLLGDEQQPDSIDARARVAERARAVLSKIPTGIFRELFIERLARAVGMPLARFKEFMPASQASRPHAGVTPPLGQARSLRGTVSTGRGKLVSQTIARVLKSPRTARLVNNAEELRLHPEAGFQCLADVIDRIHEDPSITTARLLEHFRDEPYYARLCELAVLPLPELSDAEIETEVKSGIVKLLRQSLEQRWQELLSKAEAGSLTAAEKTEMLGMPARLKS
jgi:DNA primase